MVVASHPAPGVLVTLVAGLLAVDARRSAAGCLAVVAAVLLGQLSIGWCNDAIDAGRDRATGRLDKPVPAGLVTGRLIAGLAAVSLLVDIPLSFLSGWRAGVAHLCAVALAWAYDLGLKATPVSIVTYAGAFGLLPAFVTLGLPGHPFAPVWAVAGGALLGAGAHLANALPDLSGDVATGVLGLPQRLGAGRSRALAAVLLFAATADLATATPDPAVIAVALIAASALAGVVLGCRRRPELAFKAAMALAGLDVVLLVAGGGRL